METTYQSIVSDVFRDLSDSKMNMENQLTNLDKKLEFYNEIYKITKDFINEWNVIRDVNKVDV